MTPIEVVSLAAAAAALATTACKQSEAKKGVGVDLANIDSSAAPGNDFFQFANGSWIKANPIPNDQSRWGTFNILGDNNRKNLRGLAEEAAAKTGAAKGSPEQMVGDFWFTATSDDSKDGEKTKAGTHGNSPYFWCCGQVLNINVVCKNSGTKKTSFVCLLIVSINVTQLKDL